MMKAIERQRARRWPGIILLVSAVGAALLAFGVWRGQCIDAPAESSAISTCSSEPAIGWPAAWIILAMCVILAIISTRQIARPRLSGRPKD